jgi:hypothetical protein
LVESYGPVWPWTDAEATGPVEGFLGGLAPKLANIVTQPWVVAAGPNVAVVLGAAWYNKRVRERSGLELLDVTDALLTSALGTVWASWLLIGARVNNALAGPGKVPSEVLEWLIALPVILLFSVGVFLVGVALARWLRHRSFFLRTIVPDGFGVGLLYFACSVLLEIDKATLALGAP